LAPRSGKSAEKQRINLRLKITAGIRDGGLVPVIPDAGFSRAPALRTNLFRPARGCKPYRQRLSMKIKISLPEKARRPLFFLQFSNKKHLLLLIKFISMGFKTVLIWTVVHRALFDF
jgi:hypothetical protein